MNLEQILGKSVATQPSMLPARVSHTTSWPARAARWLFGDPGQPFPRTWYESLPLPFYLLAIFPALRLVVPASLANPNGAPAALLIFGLVVGLAGLAYPTRRLIALALGVFWFVAAMVAEAGQPNAYVIAVPILIVSAGFLLLCNWAENRRQQKSNVASNDASRAAWLPAHLTAIRDQTPVTLPGAAGTTTMTGLRAGEVTRHFDSQLEASINGMLDQRFRTSSWELFGNSWYGFGGASTWGTSTVKLGVQGAIREDMTNDSFTAVLERSGPSGPDVVRLVVPSAGTVHDYVQNLIWSWQRSLQVNSHSELVVRTYLDGLANTIVCDASYVADRLGAITRMDPSSRPSIAVVGTLVNEHSLLAGGIQFGPDGHWYQLFPIALINAIADLMNGRIPALTTPNPPNLPEPDVESASTVAPHSSPLPTPSANGESPAAAVDSQPASELMHQLSVATIGHFRLALGDDDLTNDLLQKPVASFMWLYTLSRGLRNPKDAISRTALADEVFPNLDPKQQRTRVRQRLSDMQSSLPPAISGCVVSDGERVRFELHACTVDVIRLRDWATAVATSTMVDQDQLNNLEQLAEAIGDGNFLPEWEALEAKVTAGQSSASTVVETVRADVDRWRAAVLIAIADAHAARGRAATAIPYLERVHRTHPNNEVAAKKLIAAYLETGQSERAREL
jgi:DNA-binding SARP family transcriptional activator/uncharacterized membrane protein YhaH (DUF805 family)